MDGLRHEEAFLHFGDGRKGGLGIQALGMMSTVPSTIGQAILKRMISF